MDIDEYYIIFTTKCHAPILPAAKLPRSGDAHPQASPMPLNHNLLKPPRTRHFLSYSKITFGRCLNDPFSSIEKPSFKHRKDPFQASKGPLSSIDRPLPLPRQIRRAPFLINSVDGQTVFGQIVLCQKRKLLVLPFTMPILFSFAHI